jgi:hypothetical protein
MATKSSKIGVFLGIDVGTQGLTAQDSLEMSLGEVREGLPSNHKIHGHVLIYKENLLVMPMLVNGVTSETKKKKQQSFSTYLNLNFQSGLLSHDGYGQFEMIQIYNRAIS